ncbi:peptidyl-prolyl cis-trans isomerase [Thalassotalea sp. PLHSN55]|uniref:peptidylprolyl isomerase n=1 Tax=Thalassotalea sp. PLHSN55 TaxID=3435888 RepID=UPI003F87970A
MIKKLLAEPLVHFLLISALFFVVYEQLNPPVAEQNIVEVSEGRIIKLHKKFKKVWRRDPTQQEFDAIIKNYVLEEIYNRQAMALGLHQGDSLIRRRLHQKMEFMLEDMTALVTPKAGELEAFYQDHQDNYLDEASYSFNQIYIDTNTQKVDLKSKIAQANEQVALGKKPHGDNSLLPYSLTNVKSSDVKRQFGDKFYQQLSQIKDNQWAGPIESGFGLHYIELTEHIPAQTKAYDLVQKKVLSDWQDARNKRMKEKYQNELLEQYQIKLNMPNMATQG